MSTPTSPSDRVVEIIEPSSRATLRKDAADLWAARDLLYLLAWRDVAVRYKQAIFGFAWAIAQPLALAVVFTVFLHRGVRGGTGSVPYPVFALSGLVPWTLFSNACGAASESLVGSANLVSKVYFPRLVIPSAALLAWLPDGAISITILGIAMGLFGVAPAWTVVLLPLTVLLVVVTAFAVSIWTAAINVAYRDVKYAVPFLLQMWLFATPVIYTAALGGGRYRALYGLNPMIGVIELFRWSLFDQSAGWPTLAVSALVIAVLLWTGLRYFRRVERYFADVI